jgi:hypothetical protein
MRRLSIGTGRPPITYEGRVCFQHWYEEFRITFKNGNQYATLADSEQFVQQQYLTFYASQEANLAHYFRNLYHLFKFVKDSPARDKRRYTSLARAQLSAYELLLLFYDGLSPKGEKFKPLIEEFGLLEHLEEKHLARHSHKGFYKPSAYK